MATSKKTPDTVSTTKASDDNRIRPRLGQILVEPLTTTAESKFTFLRLLEAAKNGLDEEQITFLAALGLKHEKVTAMSQKELEQELRGLILDDFLERKNSSLLTKEQFNFIAQLLKKSSINPANATDHRIEEIRYEFIESIVEMALNCFRINQKPLAATQNIIAQLPTFDGFVRANSPQPCQIEQHMSNYLAVLACELIFHDSARIRTTYPETHQLHAATAYEIYRIISGANAFNPETAQQITELLDVIQQNSELRSGCLKSMASFLANAQPSPNFTTTQLIMQLRTLVLEYYSTNGELSIGQMLKSRLPSVNVVKSTDEEQEEERPPRSNEFVMPESEPARAIAQCLSTNNNIKRMVYHAGKNVPDFQQAGIDITGFLNIEDPQAVMSLYRRLLPLLDPRGRSALGSELGPILGKKIAAINDEDFLVYADEIADICVCLINRHKIEDPEIASIVQNLRQIGRSGFNVRYSSRNIQELKISNLVGDCTQPHGGNYESLFAWEADANYQILQIRYDNKILGKVQFYIGTCNGHPALIDDAQEFLTKARFKEEEHRQTVEGFRYALGFLAHLAHDGEMEFHGTTISNSEGTEVIFEGCPAEEATFSKLGGKKPIVEFLRLNGQEFTEESIQCHYQSLAVDEEEERELSATVEFEEIINAFEKKHNPDFNDLNSVAEALVTDSATAHLLHDLFSDYSTEYPYLWKGLIGPHGTITAYETHTIDYEIVVSGEQETITINSEELFGELTHSKLARELLLSVATPEEAKKMSVEEQQLAATIEYCRSEINKKLRELSLEYLQVLYGKTATTVQTSLVNLSSFQKQNVPDIKIPSP